MTMLSTYDFSDLVEAALCGDLDRVRMIARHGMSSFELSLIEKRTPATTAQYDEGFQDGEYEGAEIGQEIGWSEGFKAGTEDAIASLRLGEMNEAADALEDRMNRPAKKAS